MDKYLTTKARPGRMVLLAENAAALLLTGLLCGWGFIAVFGFLADGFMPVAHTLMLLVAIPFVMLLSALLERKRARVHARAIVSALCLADKPVIPCGELEKATGMYKCDERIVKLTARQYLRNVAVIYGEVRLADQEYKQAVCSYCGASLSFRTERLDKCPSCGSSAIKY